MTRPKRTSALNSARNQERTIRARPTNRKRSCSRERSWSITKGATKARTLTRTRRVLIEVVKRFQEAQNKARRPRANGQERVSHFWFLSGHKSKSTQKQTDSHLQELATSFAKHSNVLANSQSSRSFESPITEIQPRSNSNQVRLVSVETHIAGLPIKLAREKYINLNRKSRFKKETQVNNSVSQNGCLR